MALYRACSALPVTLSIDYCNKLGGYCYYSFTLFIIFDCPCFLFTTANSVSSTAALLYLVLLFNVGCVLCPPENKY